MKKGIYKPTDCSPVEGQSVAIIIPFRDQLGVRRQQLFTLLHYMIPILIRQNIKYGFYVINQSGNALFNRAKLLNIGFDYVSDLDEFDCFIFHDVDLILENDKAIYKCIDGVAQHYSGYIDKFDYQLLYKKLFGGITGKSCTFKTH